MKDNDFSIQVKNITKVYKLYKEPIDRLKEALNPFGKIYHKNFKALENITFDIKKGEVVGIIGKNGAGKSTLLKILTGVLTQTEGSINVKGKISALLELGAGFNPELTGIENIKFHANINGLEQSSLDEKIQEIIDFADIGDFIYQPLKMYSSGMKSRLGFALAISIVPEILIVDEALSVGDIRFKQKSMRKMKELIEGDECTVLFVSHDMGAVKNFCSRVIWLDKGTIKAEGDPEDIVNQYGAYMAYGLETKRGDTKKPVKKQLFNDDIEWDDVSKCDSFGEGGAKITHTALYKTDSNEKVTILDGGEKLRFFIKIDVKEDIYSPGIGLQLKDKLGNIIFTLNNYVYDIKLDMLSKDTQHIIQIDFVFPNIKNGDYTLTIALSDGTQDNHIQQHWVHDAVVLKVFNYKEIYKRSGLLILDQDNINIDLLSKG